MATCKLMVDVKIKYPRLLMWINAPLVLMGFNAVVPKWMIDMSEPYVTGP